jgi:hypothetical protein
MTLSVMKKKLDPQKHQDDVNVWHRIVKTRKKTQIKCVLVDLTCAASCFELTGDLILVCDNIC